MFSTSACPNCGADSRDRVWTEGSGGLGLYRGPLKIRTDANKIIGTELQALVCKQCGYVQFFVSPLVFQNEEQKKDKG
jgi:predicted nucleic-acid-binding Zn-ribbon protein